MLANIGDRKYASYHHGPREPQRQQNSRQGSSRPGSGRRSILSRAGEASMGKPSSSNMPQSIGSSHQGIHSSVPTRGNMQPYSNGGRNPNPQPSGGGHMKPYPSGRSAGHQQNPHLQRQSEQKSTKGGFKMELDHAMGFAGNLNSSLFFYRKQSIAVAGGSVVIGDLHDIHNQRFLRGGHENHICCMDVSRASELIATGNSGKCPDVIVWSIKSGKPVHSLQEHESGISTVAFSDDGRFLATCGDISDRKLFIWDMKSGMIVASTMFEPVLLLKWGGRVRDKKRRPTNNFLFATVSYSGKTHKVSLWSLNPASGRLSSCVCNCGNHVRNYTCMEFSPDGEWLYAGTTTGDVAIFQVRRSVLYSVANMNGVAGLIHSMDVSRTAEQTLYIGGSNGTVAKLEHDGKTFRATKKVKLDGVVKTISLSEDGSSLLAGTSSGSVFNIDDRDFKCELVSESHCSVITNISFPRESSERFCTATSSGEVWVWDTNKYKVIAKAYLPGLKATCVDFLEDVIVGGFNSNKGDGVIQAFYPEDCSRLWNIPNAHKGGVTAIAVANNYKFIVSGGYEGDVRVWEMRTRSLIAVMKEHRARVNSLCLYDTNKYVLSCSRDKSFLCWDLMSSKRITAHAQPMGGINGITLTPDQKSVITVGQERRVSLWNLRHPEPVASWNNGGEAMCVVVAKKLPIVATGGEDQVVYLWDLRNGKFLAKGVGHSARITDMCFSPDDAQLVTVGEDHTILVWNVFAM